MIDAKEAATISQEINDKANKLIDDLTFNISVTIKYIAADHFYEINHN